MTFVLFKKDDATHGVTSNGLSVYLPTTEVATPPKVPSHEDMVAFAMGSVKILPKPDYAFVAETSWLVLALSESAKDILGVVTGSEEDFTAYHDANTFFTLVSEDGLAGYSDMTPLLSSDSKLGVKAGWDAHLAQDKLAKLKDIDKRTEELISAGFTFKDHKFSCSQNAQSTWNTMFLLKKSITPVNVNTLDDTASITLEDEAAVDAFYGSYALFARKHLDAGSEIKTKIREAADELAVSAIKDER